MCIRDRHKRGYDLIFHLIPKENDVLKNRLIDKYGIINFDEKFKKFNQFHYAKMISNQFANRQNGNETINGINEMYSKSKQKNAERIAINIDYDNIRHYFYFKQLFIEIFAPTNIVATFFLNKVIELTEQEDIDKI